MAVDGKRLARIKTAADDYTERQGLRTAAGALLVLGLIPAVGLDISLHPQVMLSGLLLALIVLLVSRPALEPWLAAGHDSAA